MRSVENPLIRWLLVLVLSFFAAFALYPLLFMALNTFKPSLAYIQNPVGLPPGFSYIDNYIAMGLRFDIPRLVFNTVSYILLALVICLGVCIPASYAFAKLRFPARNGLRLVLIATLIVPGITLIVPIYVLMANLGLVGTSSSFISVVIVWAATSVPGSVFLLSSLMRGIPGEVLEAAKLDGAGYFEIMRQMVIPLSMPGILTITIFNVTGWWNDLLIPLVFLQTDETKTVTVAAATILGRYTSDTPLLLTGLLLASLPPVIVYILLQGYIRRGLVIGSVK